MKKKQSSEKKNELFNFQDEIVIGINSPKALQEKKEKRNTSNKKQITDKKKKSKAKKKKTPNKKEQKNKSQFNPVLKWTILIILLIGAIIYFMMSPLFNIREITVEGAQKISEQEIKSLSQLTTGENIYKFSKPKTIESIKENPYVETVEISRLLPNKVNISITERKPTFLIEMGGGYIYLDNQGYALEIAEEKLELPIITSLTTDLAVLLPGSRLYMEDLLKLEDVIEIVSAAKSNEVYDEIVSINMENSSNYTLLLNDGKTVYVGDTSNLNVKMLYLKTILEREKGILGEVFLNGENGQDIFFREKI